MAENQQQLFDTSKPPPHNRLGIDYRAVPPRKVAGPIFDVHTHCHNVQWTKTYLEAADAYGIGKIWTMAPLEDVDALKAAYPGRFAFIAVPRWSGAAEGFNEAYVTDWLRRLDQFYDKGARLIKFHMAPGTKKRWAMDLEHPLIQRVIKHAYQLGFHFMTHVGDPLAWFRPGGKYADRKEYDSFADQFILLERFLAAYPERIHMGAHMGGSLEDLDALQQRLDRFPNYCIDSSATKWIVRGVAEQPAERVRDFIIRNQDRILFGSDLVVGEKYDWDHYASRYWVHQMMWETTYRGESPIDDPDAERGVPKLSGLDLPAEVLTKMYRTNAEKWLGRL
jgi:hypothetical protein